MKIVQFGLCYSPNLGDGVISDCLAHGLRSRRPGAKVMHVDISARQARGDVTFGNRALLLAILDRMPLRVRQHLALWKLNRLIDGVAEHWRIAAQADLAVIGGGQIFSDVSLNFPIKLGRVATILHDARTPTAVYAAGVSRNWSCRGRPLFAGLLKTDLRMVGVRDTDSRAAWADQMPGGPVPVLTADPGLLAASCYGLPQGWENAAENRVGLCVTDFGILTHHADGGVAGSRGGPVAFYAGVAAALVARGQRVTLFCNGAAEDRALMARVAAAPGLTKLRDQGKLLVPPVADTPSALAHQIAGFGTVVAHRLHACIVAYSYGRPIIGLGWDSKLKAFFDLTGTAEVFSADPAIDGGAVADLVERAQAAGLDTARHSEITALAWHGIDRLLACAVTPPGTG